MTTEEHDGAPALQKELSRKAYRDRQEKSEGRQSRKSMNGAGRPGDAALLTADCAPYGGGPMPNGVQHMHKGSDWSGAAGTGRFGAAAPHNNGAVRRSDVMSGRISSSGVGTPDASSNGNGTRSRDEQNGWASASKSGGQSKQVNNNGQANNNGNRRSQKTKFCMFHLQGVCRHRDTTCAFAHSPEEMHRHRAAENGERRQRGGRGGGGGGQSNGGNSRPKKGADAALYSGDGAGVDYLARTPPGPVANDAVWMSSLSGHHGAPEAALGPPAHAVGGISMPHESRHGVGHYGGGACSLELLQLPFEPAYGGVAGGCSASSSAHLLTGDRNVDLGLGGPGTASSAFAQPAELRAQLASQLAAAAAQRRAPYPEDVGLAAAFGSAAAQPPARRETDINWQLLHLRSLMARCELQREALATAQLLASPGVSSLETRELTALIHSLNGVLHQPNQPPTPPQPAQLSQPGLQGLQLPGGHTLSSVHDQLLHQPNQPPTPPQPAQLSQPGLQGLQLPGGHTLSSVHDQLATLEAAVAALEAASTAQSQHTPLPQPGLGSLLPPQAGGGAVSPGGQWPYSTPPFARPPMASGVPQPLDVSLANSHNKATAATSEQDIKGLLRTAAALLSQAAVTLPMQRGVS
eukprot:TRINITY_DN3544_c0_g1_i2.p1 TRINITY_DN3544_c0_g1~~TRINITY_DN3544_c0_g1_i2.p1  ORF type:complete len:635 (+),score=93.64 TRINITY_DN3544_c0_g1_i2:258-2162(+)